MARKGAIAGNHGHPEHDDGGEDPILDDSADGSPAGSAPAAQQTTRSELGCTDDPGTADAKGEGGGPRNSPAPSFASIPTLADYLVNGFWPWFGGAPHHWDHTNISINIQDLTAAEQTIAQAALTLWHDVANISFTYTAGAADITYVNDGSGVAVGGPVVDISSDWAGGAATGNYSYFFQTYLHETGHALGLGHQGPYNNSATYGVDNIYTNDTWRWSVMSYFSQSSYGSDTTDYVLTPEMADIYAVQSIYGAQTTRGGNTTYGFNSTAGSFYDFATYSGTPAFTLYDSGGNDTLDASLYSNFQVIDLTPGAWSSIGGYTDNIGIYLTTTIENAIGGSGNDTIYGNDAGNSLYGNAGNDTLMGRDGDDTLNGGDGNDLLNGGSGNDTASYASAAGGITISLAIVAAQNTGGAGTDALNGIENLTGSSFNDVLTGDAGTNILTGGAGNDTLAGGAGNDMLNGGAGNDTLTGGNGNDTANYEGAASGVTVALIAGVQNTGGAGSDTLSSIENLTGSSFNDTLTGDSGANALLGGDGNDKLLGGAGNDTLNGGHGDDRLDGGAGNDTANYSNAAVGVTVNLAIAGAQNTGGAGIDTLSNIENLIGSDFADVLTASASGSILAGRDGNDALNAGNGNDTLSGGDGNDTANYTGAALGIIVSLAIAGAQNTGGAGIDTLTGIENLTGSSFNDTLTGDAAANTLRGGAGTDTLKGGGGNDTASYEGAAAGVTVALIAGAQNTGGAGIDTLVSIENLSGSSFNDILTGNASANTLLGGDGNDTLNGGSGNDTASYATAAAGITVSLATSAAQNTGGAGIDTLSNIENLTGSQYDDVLTAGASASILTGGDGNDRLDSGAGNDTMNGGAGNDTASYASAMASVEVSLTIAGAQNTGGAGIDTLSSIENLTGSAYDDVLTGDDAANTLLGGNGNDALNGGNGNDTLNGASGNDTACYEGAASSVTVALIGGAQNTGGAGTDTLISIENLTGSSFNDTLTGNAAANTLRGGDGDDTLNGGSGDDTASYEGAASNVTVSLGSGGPQYTGGAGIDTLVSIENLTGSSFNDNLYGDAGANTLTGADGDDGLHGGVGNDTLVGGFGQDIMSGDAGADVLTGDDGNDLLYGGDGNDKLLGGEGDDQLVGGDGDNILLGGDGDDRLYGGDGNDMLLGGEGDDQLYGGDGDNIFLGGDGDDVLYGGNGNDTAGYEAATSAVVVALIYGAQNTGGAGIDTLYGIENLTGSSFNDTLTGDGGANTLTGGDGDDTLDGGDGNDTLNGGGGNDTASYEGAAAGVTVALIAGAQNTGGAGTDTLVSIENLTGSRFNDTLTGNGAANILLGGDGNDMLNGGSGNDTASYATAAAGVRVSLAISGAQNTGGAGTDTLISLENLTGSQYDDVLTARASASILTGGDGNDTLNGGKGNDTLNGGDGNDTASYEGAAGSVTVALVPAAQDTGGAGIDTLIGIENLAGSGFNDTLTGDAAANTLRGGNGNDTLNGGAGNDTASYEGAAAGVTVALIAGAQNTGGAGTDTLIGIENLAGSSFNDTLTGNAAANTLRGGDGNDTLNGGTGNDTASYEGATAGVTVVLIAGAQNTGGAGTDTLIGIENLTGSSLNDFLSGNAGANVLAGGDGNDTLNGGSGNDALNGGDGNDTASYEDAVSSVAVALIAGPQNTGGGGTDTLTGMENLTGSSFDDTLTGDGAANTLQGGDGNDTLNGGDGNDTASYEAAASAVAVALIAGAQNTGGAGTDTLIGIENLTGSSFNDTLTGDTGANTLNGGGGNDTLKGGSGSDTASYEGAAAGVTVALIAGAQNTGGAGTDTLVSIENLTGSSFNDILTGNAAANTLLGGDGNDTLNGGDGNDTASYESAASGITVGLWNGGGTWNTGGAGIDTLVSIENLTGSRFNDNLYGDAGANILNGGGGDDVLYGNDGDDTLLGGNGDDVLYGNNGNNTLVGGFGRDIMSGNAGADIFEFNAVDESGATSATRDQILSFEQGTDTIDLSGIDASTAAAGNQAFAFIGAAAFHGIAGELRQSTGGTTVIMGDINGDGAADFQIQLNGSYTLTSGNFSL